MLLSSHLLHEVQQVCDSVAILSHGRLIAQGEVQELLSGRGAVRIRTTDDAIAAEVLSSMPWVSEVRSEDGGLLVVAPPDRSPEVSAVLSDNGVHISEMAQTQQSLEEYYLRVTDQGTPHSEEVQA